MFIRQQMDLFSRRLEEPRRFLQVLMGPRQVGKTTLVRQCLEKLSLPSQYASADEPLPPGSVWIEQQWEVGRNLLSQSRGEAVLVLDEIQKIPHWSSLVKRLWDEDSAAGRRLKVVLLGSSPLLIQSGLTESLAGRFEIVRIPHWSYSEMEQAFGWNLEQFIFFGFDCGRRTLAPLPSRFPGRDDDLAGYFAAHPHRQARAPASAFFIGLRVFRPNLVLSKNARTVA